MRLREIDRDLARDSFYNATANSHATYPALTGSVECDVAVVGGGLAGLSAALELSERGHRVRLLEAVRIGHGASGRNGGQAIHGLSCDQAVVEAQLEPADARRVWDMTIEALVLLRKRIARHKIDCDWREGHLSVAVNARKARQLAEHADRLESVYGYALQRIDRAHLHDWIASPRYAAALHDPRSGHLHPLNYTLGMARVAAASGASLHEQSPVTRIDHGPVAALQTPHGIVRARQVLLAGNVYLQGLVPELSTRIMPVGTYMVATETIDARRAHALIPCGAAVSDTNVSLDYFRLQSDPRAGDRQRLLYGGRTSYSTLTPKDLTLSMRRNLETTFPQLRGVSIEHTWGGFVDISMNRAPDFGRLPAKGRAANVYYLQGFSGHGLALAGLAGKLVAEAIDGDASSFDVFARLRHRPFPGGRWLRTPSLVLGMAWYRLRDLLT
ncbi:MAG: FAD-binding oxidoreductase [Ideonella sp.]|nr:FAD-binding oxidoreductase [Ideonella sp.]